MPKDYRFQAKKEEITFPVVVGKKTVMTGKEPRKIKKGKKKVKTGKF